MQWQKLVSLLHYAYQWVPYYKRRFDEINLNPKDIRSPQDFRHVPLLTKQDIQLNFKDMVSRHINKRELNSSRTGGSTGEMLTFYRDRQSENWGEAIYLRNYRWLGLEYGERHIFLWGAPCDVNLRHSLFHKIRETIFNRMWLDAFNLKPETMKEYVYKINEFKPRVLSGYANVLYNFARFMQEEHLTIKVPLKVLSTAEVLRDYQREMIETVFQTKVFDQYGCRELGGGYCTRVRRTSWLSYKL